MRTDRWSNESVEKAFGSYVKSCLQHASRDYFEKLRRDSSHVTLLDAVAYEVNISFCICSTHSPRVEDSPIFEQVIEQMPLSSTEKKVVYFKYYEDKTDKEIARILGVSRQAVTKSKSNILLKLKRHLEM
ncbi:RNA polymerase sigma factor [Paenibacillus durus]|uniref:RNA polymerase sigma-70 region 4 domain-containing protein n=1 Tax=Paenibacillus durus TaxID=44251 RepID=A0A089HRZ9_PAEDU|nr:sigma factor-like helix-turn-helix DNA-binding protein [Paenibacillus durus]AIQ13852.1 hypothetical protein PDUR_19520 [Paenibacillus durus]